MTGRFSDQRQVKLAMKQSLSSEQINAVFQPLQAFNTDFAKHYPGEIQGRQPVQTLYGGAQLFKADTTKKMGHLSLRALDTYAPNFVVLARVRQWASCFADFGCQRCYPASWQNQIALLFDYES